MIYMTLLTTQTVFCSCSPPCLLSQTEQNLYSQLILSSQVCQEVLQLCAGSSLRLCTAPSLCSGQTFYIEHQSYRDVIWSYNPSTIIYYYFLLLLIFCVSECFACICVIALHVCTWCSWWSVEEIGFPGCDSPSRY